MNTCNEDTAVPGYLCYGMKQAKQISDKFLR